MDVGKTVKIKNVRSFSSLLTFQHFIEIRSRSQFQTRPEVKRPKP
jgi:hypothetical protein